MEKQTKIPYQFLVQLFIANCDNCVAITLEVV